jgi:hypothetical protein
MTISRTSAGPTNAAVDRYFEKVQQLLRDANMPLSWKPPQPIHSDVVAVEIFLRGSRYSFNVAYGEGAISVPLDESQAYRRRRAALDEILIESSKYVAARHAQRSIR